MEYIISLVLTFLQLLIFIEIDNLFLDKSDCFKTRKPIFALIIFAAFTVFYIFDLELLSAVFGLFICAAFLAFLYNGDVKSKFKIFIVSNIIVHVSSFLFILLLSVIIGNPYMGSSNEDTFFGILDILATMILYLLLYLLSIKIKFARTLRFSLLKYALALIVFNVLALICTTRYLLSLQKNIAGIDELVLFVLAGATILIVVVILLMRALQADMEKQYDTQLLTSTYKTQLEFYKDMETTMSELRRLRHDMKNHFIAIQGYLNDNEIELAKEYLKKISPEHSSTDLILVPNNPLLSALLSKYKFKCDEHNIPFTYQVALGKVTISAPDLAVIVGNILDNAFEASLKAKPEEAFINIVISSKLKCILIHCRNHYSEQLTRVGSFFKTSKGDALNHGIGLKSVSRVVDSLNGTMKISADNHIFDILLYIHNSII